MYKNNINVYVYAYVFLQVFIIRRKYIQLLALKIVLFKTFVQKSQFSKAKLFRERGNKFAVCCTIQFYNNVFLFVDLGTF